MALQLQPNTTPRPGVTYMPRADLNTTQPPQTGFRIPIGELINNDYSGLSGYGGAYDQLYRQLQALHSDSGVAQRGLNDRLVNVGNQFKSMFTNLVGRAPSDEELNKFFTEQAGQIITGSPMGRSEADALNVRNQIGTYVGDTFQQAANDYASQQLEGQKGEANRLADLFRTQGRQAISDTEGKLLDYQNRLFERLRPNLITSLQSQGLLNSGALNESLAGAAKDLSDAAQSQLLDMNFQNEQGANAIAYGGESAPYMFQQQATLNRPQQFQQQSMDALNRAFQTYTQNLDFRNQLGLIGAQKQAKSSFFDTLGQSFASSMGQGLGNIFNPAAYQKK